MRLLIRALIGTVPKIVVRAILINFRLGILIGIAAKAVRHPHKDSKRDYDRDSSEGCEAFW